MESSIAGLLILSVLIVAVVLMSQAYVASNTLLGTAMVESVNLADERSRPSCPSTPCFATTRIH